MAPDIIVGEKFLSQIFFFKKPDLILVVHCSGEGHPHPVPQLARDPLEDQVGRLLGPEHGDARPVGGEVLLPAGLFHSLGGAAQWHFLREKKKTFMTLMAHIL